MPRTILFHLDENCNRAIAEGLRRRGVDVTTTPELGMLASTDDEQLAGISHADIVYCGKDTRSIGDIIQGLVLIWEIMETAEMLGRVEYL
jgi:hypothetical protein